MQVLKGCPVKIRIVITTKILKQYRIKIRIVLRPAENLNRSSIKHITVLQRSPVEITNVLTTQFVHTGITKVLTNGTKGVFPSHSVALGLLEHSSAYSKCTRLILSFTQQAAQIWHSHFLSPLSMA